MKIFLTGGHGFIGSYVVKQLVKRGDSVRCLVRKTSDASRLDAVDWERFEGDVRDPKSVLEGMRGCDAVIHLASPSSWNDIDSPHMKDIVESGTRYVLEAAKELGGLRVIYCSSVIAVNGTSQPTIQNEDTPFTLNDPTLVYAMSKNAAEKICEEFSKDVPVITVCPSEVYGPWDTGMVTAGNLIDFAKSSPVMVCHGGTSVAHVEDVALGIVKALDDGRPGERYILGGDNLTVEELAKMTLSILGRKASVVKVPTPILVGLTKAATTVGIPLPYNPLVIPYATKFWFMDNKKAVDELGASFRPARETLESTLEWLKEAGHI